MGDHRSNSLSRRRVALSAAAGLTAALAGCGGDTENQWNPDQSPTEPDKLVINAWDLAAVESGGEDYKLECSLSVQNTESEYAVASDIAISTAVREMEYSTSEEIAVRSGSTAEFVYDLGDGNLPEESYHSINADTSEVTLGVSIEGEERLSRSGNGAISGSR